MGELGNSSHDAELSADLRAIAFKELGETDEVSGLEVTRT